MLHFKVGGDCAHVSPGMCETQSGRNPAQKPSPVLISRAQSAQSSSTFYVCVSLALSISHHRDPTAEIAKVFLCVCVRLAYFFLPCAHSFEMTQIEAANAQQK